MSQLMPTIQIINGQPVLQAKVQHVVTSNGPMTVAVLPADIGNFLRPLLQQQHAQLQFPSLQAATANSFLINMSSNHVLPLDKEQVTTAATTTVNHKKAAKRPRSKRSDPLATEIRYAGATSEGDPAELKVKAFPRIQPKLIEPQRTGPFLCSAIENTPSFIVSSLAAAQLSPPPAAPAAQKQITIQLNDEEQRTVESLSEQIVRLSAVQSLTAGQEELLQALEQKRRSLLEQAALKQLRLNAVNAAIAQQKQQQAQAQAQAAFVRSQGFNSVAAATVNNSFVPSLPLPLLSGSSIPQQQLVHINGAPFLLVQQPKPPPTSTALLAGDVAEAKTIEARTAGGAEANDDAAAATVKAITPTTVTTLAASRVDAQAVRYAPATTKTSSKGGGHPPSSRRISKPRSRVEAPNNTTSQRSCGIRRQLLSEQTAVVHPNCRTPFTDINDVVNRLLPYHICCDPDYSADILKHVDTVFQKKLADLVEKQKPLYQRLHSILLKRASVETPNEEQALVDQLISTNEAELLNAEKELLSKNPDEFYQNCEKWKSDLESKRVRRSVPSSPDVVHSIATDEPCSSSTSAVPPDDEHVLLTDVLSSSPSSSVEAIDPAISQTVTPAIGLDMDQLVEVSRGEKSDATVPDERLSLSPSPHLDLLATATGVNNGYGDRTSLIRISHAHRRRASASSRSSSSLHSSSPHLSSSPSSSRSPSADLSSPASESVVSEPFLPFDELTSPAQPLTVATPVPSPRPAEHISNERCPCVGGAKNLKLIFKLNGRRQYIVQSRTAAPADSAHWSGEDSDEGDVTMETNAVSASPRVPPLRLRLTSLVVNNEMDCSESIGNSSSESDPECSRSLVTERWRIQDLAIAGASVCDRRPDL